MVGVAVGGGIVVQYAFFDGGSRLVRLVIGVRFGGVVAVHGIQIDVKIRFARKLGV